MASESIYDIDPLRLDDEWYGFPKAYKKVALRLPEARKRMEHAKAQIKVVYGELFLDMKANPGRYNFIKSPSDKVIEAAIPTVDEYKEALAAYLDLKEVVDLLEAKKEVLDSKKKALENAVTLHISHYSSEPRVKHPDAKEYTDNAKKRLTRKKGRK